MPITRLEHKCASWVQMGGGQKRYILCGFPYIGHIGNFRVCVICAIEITRVFLKSGMTFWGRFVH